MDLYLIRHAEAVTLSNGDAGSDAERQLTEDGEEQARQLAAGLQRKGIRIARVLSSPLVRARVTAEIMLRNWATPAPELVLCDELAPGMKRRKLAKVLRSLQLESVALVGHQPDLGEFAAWLIGSRKAQLDFSKAGVAHLACHDEPDKGAATLVWLVTHDWLRV